MSRFRRQVDADCLENEEAAKEACKQLGLRLGGDEYVQKEAFRSLEGKLSRSQSLSSFFTHATPREIEAYQ